MAMTVIDVEAASGVPADSIRWYLRSGLLKPRRNPANGYYEFGASDLTELRFIVRAKNLGFGLAEVREVLAMSRRHETLCAAVRDIVSRRADVAVELEALQAMERRMRRAMRAPTAKHLSKKTGRS